MPKGGIRPSCSLEDCDLPHTAKGFCRIHYVRWKKCGDPYGEVLRKVENGESLLEKLTKKFLRGISKLEDGCWTCTTASSTRSGYLHIPITHDGVRNLVKVHRFSYEHFVGPIPEGMLICHKCDNRWCCNPDHLFVGSQSDNMQDMVRKGRGLVGEKNANTSFTESDVISIYADIDSGLTRTAIAKKHGVSAVTISHIATGRNWKHLFERLRA